MERYHLQLAEHNPKLIYAHAQGFNRIPTARGSLPTTRPCRPHPNCSTSLGAPATSGSGRAAEHFADKVAALTIVYPALAALVHQRATGQRATGLTIARARDPA